jgi:hypothetical protein
LQTFMIKTFYKPERNIPSVSKYSTDTIIKLASYHYVSRLAQLMHKK